MAYKYYNQNDYPEIPYGDGSIETSGCGLCSCCMVVENMTGHSFTPAEAARLSVFIQEKRHVICRSRSWNIRSKTSSDG